MFRASRRGSCPVRTGARHYATTVRAKSISVRSHAYTIWQKRSVRKARSPLLVPCWRRRWKLVSRCLAPGILTPLSLPGRCGKLWIPWERQRQKPSPQSTSNGCLKQDEATLAADQRKVRVQLQQRQGTAKVQAR